MHAGEQHAAAAFLHNVGVQRLDCGEPGPAIAALREAARRLARLGRQAELGRALYNLGHAAQLIGGRRHRPAVGRPRARDRGCAGDEVTRRVCATACRPSCGCKLGDRKAVAAAARRSVRAGRVPAGRGREHPRTAGGAAARPGRARARGRHRSRRPSATRAMPHGEAAEIEPAIARCQLELEQATAKPRAAPPSTPTRWRNRRGSLDARLRARVDRGARGARIRRPGDCAALRLTEVRTLLDHAARSLPPAERARLRAVDAVPRGARGSCRARSAARADRRARRALARARGRRQAPDRRTPSAASVRDRARVRARAVRGRARLSRAARSRRPPARARARAASIGATRRRRARAVALDRRARARQRARADHDGRGQRRSAVFSRQRARALAALGAGAAAVDARRGGRRDLP